MLKIRIPDIELYDESKECFVNIDETTLLMEHSLSSVYNWESKYKKPFLTDKEKTEKESIDYVRFMTLNDVDDIIFEYFPSFAMEEVNQYISDPMTATTFNTYDSKKGRGNRRGEVITAEVIYYMMASYNIPFECDQWNLNRLLTLIQVANIKSSPPKKMSKAEIRKQYAELNAARRAKLGTTG